MKKKPSKPQPKELIWRVDRWVSHITVCDIPATELGLPGWVSFHHCKSSDHAKKMLANIPGLVRVIYDGVDVTAQLVTEIKNENG